MRRSVILLLPLAACVPQPKSASPVAVPAPLPVAPPPAAPPLAADWRDWPQTPGGWRYAGNGAGSTAEFGGGSRTFAIACDRANRRVTLTGGGVAGAKTMTVRSTSTARTISIIAAPDPSAEGSASLAATDPLLDALAFSRGRFAIEWPGAPPLVLPAWAEVGRVIQDCRG